MSDSVSSADYHDDNLGTPPSLSSSLAQLIINESPLHCWNASPRLNPNARREYSEAMDLGSIVHALLLEGSTAKLHLVQACKTEGSGKNKVSTDVPVDDWRTAAAREERDQARAEGEYPVLQCDWPNVEAMHTAAVRQLKALKIDLSEGAPEVTLKWQEENGVYCRARLDWLRHDNKRILDYKSTGASANPDIVSRTLFSNGYEMQHAFYRRAVQMVYGENPEFEFIFQETRPPYAMSIVGLDPMSIDYADRRVRMAIERFGECMESGVWPGYPQRTCYAALPSYLDKAQEEREMRDTLV